MSEKKEYVSPRIDKLEFDFNDTVTASGEHQLKINLEEGDCGQSEDTVVFSESYGSCNTWVSCY